MEECSICLDELVGSIVILKCKHKYHDICIGTWYESNIKNNTNFVCPQCNTVTDIETIINVEMNPHFTDNPNIVSDSPSIVSDNSIIASDGPNIVSDNSIIASDSPNITSDNSIAGSDNSIMESDNSIMESDNSIIASDSPSITSDNSIAGSDNQSVVYTPLNMRSRNTTSPITRTNMEPEMEQDDIIINKNKCIRCCIS